MKRPSTLSRVKGATSRYLRLGKVTEQATHRCRCSFSVLLEKRKGMEGVSPRIGCGYYILIGVDSKRGCNRPGSIRLINAD